MKCLMDIRRSRGKKIDIVLNYCEVYLCTIMFSIVYNVY